MDKNLYVIITLISCCLYFCNGHHIPSNKHPLTQEEREYFKKVSDEKHEQKLSKVHSNTRFKYYSKSNPNVELSQADVEKMNLHGKKIAVYSHGFPLVGFGSLKKLQSFEMKDALLHSQTENYDLVVLVDWVDTTNGIPKIDESFAAREVVPIVASHVKEKLLWLKGKGVDPLDIDLAGHSMGAHVCGQAGRSFFKETGEKIAKITGLDPAGRPFKDKDMASLLLGKGDAIIVKTINTSKKIGYYAPLGDENEYPDVRSHCPIWNFLGCKHRVAKDFFMMELNGKDFSMVEDNNSNETECSSSIILVLDVSPSMTNNNRFQAVETSSKRLISSLMDGSCIAIIKFGGYAVVTLPPTRIQDEHSKTLAMGAVPSAKDQIMWTSIGAGMQAAINLINGFQMMKCANINLMTDGEENRPPYLSEVSKNIPPCTRVSSIALGNQADRALEGLSLSTGGRMSSVSDLNSLNKLWKTEWDLLYSSLPPYNRPVRFPVKELGNSNPFQEFLIDEGAAKNNHWFLSHPDYGKLNPLLISPSGKQYTKDKFLINNDIQALELQVKNPETGTWKISVDQERTSKEASRNKRNVPEPVVVFVTAEPTPDTAIAIDAKLTSSTLDYTIPGNVSILAAITKGEDHVIIRVKQVKALLAHPTNASDVTTVILRDDGAGADEFKDDGIYSRYLTKPLKLLYQNLRYEVTVIAEGGYDARVRSAEAFEPLSESEFESLPKAGPFEREITAGSVRPINNYIEPTPSPVRDLKVEAISLTDKTITLSWTATGLTLDEGTALSNNLSVSVDPSFQTNTLPISQTDATLVVEGSIVPILSGSSQSVCLNIPEAFWNASLLKIKGEQDFPELYFKISSEGTNRRFSQHSNIASTAQFAMENESEKESQSWGSIGIIIVIVVFICGISIGIFGVWNWRLRVLFFETE